MKGSINFSLANKEKINDIISDRISNNLTEEKEGNILDATQGKILNNSIDEIKDTYLPLKGGTMEDDAEIKALNGRLDIATIVGTGTNYGTSIEGIIRNKVFEIDLADTTIYDKDKYYPVVGSIIQRHVGLIHIKATASLAYSGVPSWSTHAKGFHALLELLVLGDYYSEQYPRSICLCHTCRHTYNELNPLGYSQLRRDGRPVFWLRGGGKYKLYADYNCKWTIYTELTYFYGEPVEPTTTNPGVSLAKSTVYANLYGNSETATKATQDGNGKEISKTYLPLAGGTMDKGASIIIPREEDDRYTELAGGVTRFYLTSTTGYSGGMAWYNQSKNLLGEMGLYGSKGIPEYYFIGSYSDPFVKVDMEGNVSIKKALPVSSGGTGKTTLGDSANALINGLSTGSDTPKDNDYYVSQSAGGGTTTTTFHRRPVSALWEYMKGKISSVLGLTASSYSGNSATATKATSANKINTNAGSATQPVYFANGIPVKCTYTLGKSVPSNAVFTDTNTTYSAGTGLTLSGTTFSAKIANNLTTATTGYALDATQGKALNDAKVNKTWTLLNSGPASAGIDISKLNTDREMLVNVEVKIDDVRQIASKRLIIGRDFSIGEKSYFVTGACVTGLAEQFCGLLIENKRIKCDANFINGTNYLNNSYISVCYR